VDQFDVVVAEGGLDAMKRLSTEPVAPDCVVTESRLRDLPLDAFLARVERSAPTAATVVVGAPPTDTDAAAALVDADAYVPDGRESRLADRVRRLLGDRRVDLAIDEHERLARTVASVAVDVARAPDRATVERGVHDRLVEGGAYRHVWIVRTDGESGLDVSVPVSGPLGEEELTDLVGGGDPTFVSRAVESGRVVSTDGHVPTRSTAGATVAGPIYDGGEMQRLSTAAVPFVHDGHIRGLSLLSTARDDAFEGAERALLADLGLVVGHALGALVGAGAHPDVGKGMENLAHELRNPLGIASSHLEIAREDGEDSSFDTVESALARMADTVDRLTENVGGEPSIDAAPEALEAAAEAAWASVEDSAASLDVVDSTVLRADDALLVRLLSNLFQNALEHGGEHVTVRVGTLADGFYVEDDGPGIPPGERETVFERGYSTSNDGLGIGLSIVRDVTTAHGWSLSVTESRDGGARFEVTGVEQVSDDSEENA